MSAKDKVVRADDRHYPGDSPIMPQVRHPMVPVQMLQAPSPGNDPLEIALEAEAPMQTLVIPLARLLQPNNEKLVLSP